MTLGVHSIEGFSVRTAPNRSARWPTIPLVLEAICLGTPGQRGSRLWPFGSDSLPDSGNGQASVLLQASPANGS